MNAGGAGACLFAEQYPPGGLRPPCSSTRDLLAAGLPAAGVFLRLAVNPAVALGARLQSGGGRLAKAAEQLSCFAACATRADALGLRPSALLAEQDRLTGIANRRRLQTHHSRRFLQRTGVACYSAISTQTASVVNSSLGHQGESVACRWSTACRGLMRTVTAWRAAWAATVPSPLKRRTA